MTIDEAIQHAEAVANSTCDECANEHRQLAEWLKELKHRRKEERHGRWKEDEDKDIYCTNCKHFLYPAEIRMQQITLSSRRLKRKFCPECGAIMDEVIEE